jgi:cobalt/nickel transport system ATP-binding protein
VSDPILELAGVSYVYDDGTAALRNIDLRLEAGERTVLLGANGSGKSTLFLVMVGILKPSSGAISLGGVPFSGKKEELRVLRRRLGLVFQDPDSQLFANSVAEDVSFGPCNLGLSEAEVEARVEAAITACGIDALRDKAPHSLSYGQKKLAAIAGVIAMGCNAILLDEPTSGLDGLHAELVEELLSKLNAGNTAIMVSTHDIEFAWRFGRNALLMRDGLIVAEDETEFLFREQSAELMASHIRLPRAYRAQEELAGNLSATSLDSLSFRPPAS